LEFERLRNEANAAISHYDAEERKRRRIGDPVEMHRQLGVFRGYEAKPFRMPPSALLLVHPLVEGEQPNGAWPDELIAGKQIEDARLSIVKKTTTNWKRPQSQTITCYWFFNCAARHGNHQFTQKVIGLCNQAAEIVSHHPTIGRICDATGTVLFLSSVFSQAFGDDSAADPDLSGWLSALFTLAWQRRPGSLLKARRLLWLGRIDGDNPCVDG